MLIVFAALLVVFAALGAGILTWKMVSGKDKKRGQDSLMYISKKGAYVEDGSLGGKSGTLFRAINRDKSGTIMIKEGEGWGRGEKRARQEIILQSLSSGKVYQGNFSRELLLGRDPAGKTDSPVIALPFASVSRVHCCLLQRDSRVFVKDLDSSYGTSVNDRRALGETEVQDGDMLQLGAEKFLIKLRAI